MSNIRLKTITVENASSPLIVKKGSVVIQDTTPSYDLASGSFVFKGGVSINTTYDASSSTAGGSLTIGGGASVLKTLQVGSDVVMDNSTSSFRIKGITSDRLLVDSNGLRGASDGISTNFAVISSGLQIYSTTQSSNPTTGSIVSYGGISVACSSDASGTNGGSLTVAGGASINKSLNVGLGITSTANNTLGNVFTVNNFVGIGNTSPVCELDIHTSSGNLLLGNSNGSLFIGSKGASVVKYLASGFDMASGTSYLTMKDTSGNVVVRFGVDGNNFLSSGSLVITGTLNATNSNNTLGNIFTTNGLVGIGTTQPSNALDIIGTSTMTGSLGVGTTSPITALDVRGDIQSYSPSSNTSLVINTENNNYASIDVGTSAGSLSKNLIINESSSATSGYVGIGTSNPQEKLQVNGNMLIASNKDINYSMQNGTGANVGMETYNTSGIHIGQTGALSSGLFVLNSSIGINTTNPVNSLDVNGNVLVTNGSLIATGNVNTVGNMFLVNGSVGVNATGPSADLTVNGSMNVLNGGLSGGESLLMVYGNIFTSGSTNYNLFEAGNGSAANFVVTGDGKVGIDTSSPNYTLDIHGTLGVNNIAVLDTTISSNSTTGALLLSGGLSINSTANASSVTNGGSLTLNGGLAVMKNTYVGGITYFKNTTPSTSRSVGAVIVQGGLTIQGNQNAVYQGNGGGLTVVGGAAVGGDLYVGGTVNGSASSSSTNAYLTLTATDEAINLTTGTLITFGGITVQCTTNATSVTNGGSLLINGGGSFNGDIYIGGSSYIYNQSNYFSAENNVIVFYDALSINRFSIDMDTSSRDFSISRYNNLGTFIEKALIISSTNGITTFSNTTASTSNNLASVVFNGGISINATQDVLNKSNGGGVTVAGGVGIAKGLLVGGNVVFTSTTPSADVSSGSVLIAGGVGVSGNLNVLGNTVVNGNLTVNGTTTAVDTTNTVINDNLLLLNSGPSGSRDSGVIVQRYQTENDTGSGDVVGDTLYTTDVLPIQSGSVTSTQVQLSVSASAQDNFYVGWWIKVASGFSVNQVRKIISYVGATRIATLSSGWTSQNPSSGDVVHLYNKPYVGVIYNEIQDRFEFGATVNDPGQTFVSFTEDIPIAFSSATSYSTTASTNSTTGSVVCYGGISVASTTNASSVTSGGCLTIAGGASISQKLYVGSLNVNGTEMTPNPYDTFSSVSFTAGNNITTLSDVTCLVFDNTVWGFDVYLAVQLTATSNMYANFHLRGINKGSTWELSKTYVGDDTGIDFEITSSGQVKYTTQNYSGFSSLIFRWRTFVN